LIPIVKTSDGIQFKVYVQPRSARNTIVGAHGKALKVKLTAPPVAGAANAMCVKLLATCLQVPKSAVEITTGHGSRHKTVRITLRSSRTNPADTAILEQRLQSLIKPEKNRLDIG
jgi:uncharacterized protein (TIGR00251 family)